MKTLLTICALAAGAGLFAMTDSAQADHGRYGRGYRYSSPVFNGGRHCDSGRHYRRHHHHHHDHGFHSSRRFDRGWGYGRYDRGYYGRRSGFAIQTPGFGLYIR